MVVKVSVAGKSMICHVAICLHGSKLAKCRTVSYRRPRFLCSFFATPGRLTALPRIGDEGSERSWHWISFLSHVASAAHSLFTSTSRPKHEPRCDSRHSIVLAGTRSDS